MKNDKIFILGWSIPLTSGSKSLRCFEFLEFIISVIVNYIDDNSVCKVQ